MLQSKDRDFKELDDPEKSHFDSSAAQDISPKVATSQPISSTNKTFMKLQDDLNKLQAKIKKLEK